MAKKLTWEEIMSKYGKGLKQNTGNTGYGAPTAPRDIYSPATSNYYSAPTTNYSAPTTNYNTTPTPVTTPTQSYSPTLTPTNGNIPLTSLTPTTSSYTKKTDWEKIMEQYGRGLETKAQKDAKELQRVEDVRAASIEPKLSVLEKIGGGVTDIATNIGNAWKQAGVRQEASKTKMEGIRAMTPEQRTASEVERKKAEVPISERKGLLDFGLNLGDKKLTSESLNNSGNSGLSKAIFKPLAVVGDIDKYLNDTNKFTARASAQAHNIALGDKIEVPSTGNTTQDAIAEMIGFAMALAMPLGGAGTQTSLGGVMNKAGAPIEKYALNLLAKKGLNTGAAGALGKMATAAAKGASEFGVLGAMEAARDNKSLTEIMTATGEAAKQGAIFGGVTKGIGLTGGLAKNIKTGKTNLQTEAFKLPPLKRNLLKGTAKTATAEVKATATKLQYKGKYSIVDTASKKAQQNYDEAMETIQNHFKTNKLTPEEVARIKPELGIDVPNLVSKLGVKTDVRKIAERNWLARVADVKGTVFEPTTTYGKEKIPFVSIKKGAKTEQIPTVMTQKTKVPATTVLKNSSERVPIARIRKTRVEGTAPAPTTKRFLASPKKTQVLTPVEGKTRTTLPTGALASGSSTTIPDRLSSLYKDASKVNYSKVTNEKKLTHDLWAIKDGAVKAGEVTKTLEVQKPRARVSGFDGYQREVIRDELAKGLTTNDKLIPIKVPNDGTLEVSNNPTDIGNILNTLKIKNTRNFEPTFQPRVERTYEAKTPTTQPLKVGKTTGAKYTTKETTGSRRQPLTKKIEVPAKLINEPIWSGTETKTLQGRTTRDVKTSGYREGANTKTTTVKQYNVEGIKAAPKTLQRPTSIQTAEYVKDVGKLKPAEAVKAVTPTPAALKKGLAPNTYKIVKGLDKNNVVISPEGLPIAEGLTNNITSGTAGAMARTQSKTRILFGKQKLPMNQQLKEGIQKLYTKTIDEANPFKVAGDTSYTLATNIKKVDATVQTILKKDLIGMDGKVLGEGLGNIIKEIPLMKEEKFLSYVSMKHNIDRAFQGKNAFKDFDVKQSSRAVGTIELLNPEFKALGERLSKFINTFEGEWGNKSGLISDDLWKNLQIMYKNYIPLKKGFSRIEKSTSGISAAGKSLVDTGNTLKKLVVGGSERDIVNPVENLINLVNTTVKTAKNNEVGQSVLNAVRSNPNMKNIAKIFPEGKKIPMGTTNIVTILEGGKPVHLEFLDQGNPLLEALQQFGAASKLTYVEQKIMKPLTGAFKGLITTKNPIFAVRNILRDLPTSYIQGSENNPIKHFGNVISAYKDLAVGTPLTKRYKGLGGEMANLVNTGSVEKGAEELMARKLSIANGNIVGSKNYNKILTGFKAMGNAVEKFNNMTESAPRYAEFKKVFAKTGDIQKALYEAGEVTTNFSRGGSVIKRLDVSVPYLNASVQGLDKFVRNFSTKKTAYRTLLKGGLAITAPQAFFHYINKDNPNYVALDNRTKDNYFLIPNGDKFIKIPKAREYGVLFGTFFDRLQRSWDGDGTTKGLGETIMTNFSPNDPVNGNFFTPMVKLMIGGEDVKDWAGRNIIPQGLSADKRSAYLQFDDTTTEIAKEFAYLIKDVPMPNMLKSPIKIDYLARSYLGVLSQMGTPLVTKSQKAGATTIPSKLLRGVTQQFSADPVYSNQAITDYYDNKDKVIQRATDQKLLLGLPKEQITYEKEAKKYYDATSKAMAERYSLITAANQADNQAEVTRLKKEIIKLAEQANAAYKPLSNSKLKKALKATK